MTHAAKFWAMKLDSKDHPLFWNLVSDWGFSGETAYQRVIEGRYTVLAKA